MSLKIGKLSVLFACVISNNLRNTENVTFRQKHNRVHINLALNTFSQLSGEK